jgi:hypothetical protein
MTQLHEGSTYLHAERKRLAQLPRDMCHLLAAAGLRRVRVVESSANRVETLRARTDGRSIAKSTHIARPMRRRVQTSASSRLQFCTFDCLIGNGTGPPSKSVRRGRDSECTFGVFRSRYSPLSSRALHLRAYGSGSPAFADA